MKLIDINDDCMFSIFELSTTLLDMVSFANVCERFRSIAQMDFRFAKPILRIPDDAGDEWDMKERETNELFQLFGSWTTRLEVRSISEMSDEKIFALMIKYCVGGKLTELNLHLSEWVQKLPIGLKPIFNKLQKLNLSCGAETEANLYEWLDAVEELTMSHPGFRSPCPAFFTHSFPNLARVSIINVAVHSHDLAMLLNKNKTIKDIALRLPLLDNATNIFNMMTQIERLTLEVIKPESDYQIIETGSFEKLSNLVSLELKVLPWDFNFVAGIAREIGTADIPLRSLKLGHTKLVMNECRQYCENLSKLVHLNIFTLWCEHTTDVNVFKHYSAKLHRISELHVDVPNGRIFAVHEILTIVSCFHNLERLVIFNNGHDDWVRFVIDSNAFERFVEIVRKRKNKTRLDIELVDHHYKVDIPFELAHQHRDIMSVRVRTGYQLYINYMNF